MSRKVPFFIDLSRQRVFCSSCRKPCRSLALNLYTLHWCANKSCPNTKEVRQYPDGVWRIFDVSENLGHHRISAITERLIQSIGARRKKTPHG